MTSQQLQPYRATPPRPQQPPQPAGLDHMLGEFLFLVFRHKWKITVCILLGIAAAAYLWFRTPTVYRSEARLLVRYITESTGADPTSAGDRVTSPDSRGANIMQSEIGIMTSRELIEKVVDELGFADFMTGREEAGEERSAALLAVSRNLHAQTARDSSIITVSYDAPNPKLAQEVLSRITRLYLEKHVEVHRAGLAYDFLSQQTDQMAARLAQTEQELQLARAETGVTDIDRAKETSGARIDEMNSQLFAAEARVAGAQARVDMLRSHESHAESPVALPYPSDSSSPDPETAALMASLASRMRSLRARESTFLATYTEQSLPVQSVRREIAKIEDEWRRVAEAMPARPLAASIPVAATNTSPVPAVIGYGLLDAMTEVASLNAQKTVIEQHLEGARQEAAKIEAGEGKIRKLERRRDIEEANYLYFAKSLEQARIDEALDSGKITNISVVQKASLPLRGLRPELLKRMGLALAIGLFAGIGLAFLLENGVHSRWFVRPSTIASVLGIPVLVSIPRMSAKALKKQQGGKSTTVAGNAKSATWVSPSGFTSYCDRLHHRMMLSDVTAKKLPVLGVTGCSSGSGVSTIASGIAMSIAREEGIRVLLATASLDSGAEVFVNEQGRVTVMDWKRTVIDQPGDSGTLPDVTSPARRFREFRDRLEGGSHGCVVLDLPPVHKDGTALSIASSLDGVVFLIEAEKDRRAVARHCLELLNAAKVPVLGVVFNKCRQYVPHWLSDEI